MKVRLINDIELRLISGEDLRLLSEKDVRLLSGEDLRLILWPILFFYINSVFSIFINIDIVVSCLHVLLGQLCGEDL